MSMPTTSTTPPGAGPQVPALATTETAVAAAHLVSARRELDAATDTLRLATRLGWESSAADACRAEISRLLGGLDADSAALDQALLVTRSCES
ncbi:hypothetical protein ACNHYB_10110 [Isoptericola jiangsuensis]|uniref:hypothetical protein n=1 Tax=Isoptericola jiangsuensis TaxID=548579 RepID=UPI003AAD654C